MRGVTLRAGMGEDEVCKALSVGNILKKCGNDGRALCVKAKDEPSVDTESDLLMFDENKLFSVSKRLGNAPDDDAAVLVSKLYALISEARAQGEEVSVWPGIHGDDAQVRLQCIDMIVKMKSYSLCSFQVFGHSGVSKIVLKEEYSLGNILRQPAKK
jgi:hypothetical protein